MLLGAAVRRIAETPKSGNLRAGWMAREQIFTGRNVEHTHGAGCRQVIGVFKNLGMATSEGRILPLSFCLFLKGCGVIGFEMSSAVSGGTG